MNSRAVRSLRHRDFRLFWLGFGVAVMGFQVQRVGLALLAYDLTGSALYLALVFGGDSIPMLLLSPLGGVLSDRADRRTVLIASRTCVAALAFVVAALTAADAIAVWHLLLFALLTGTCYALDVPARQAMIHALVPAEDFVGAVALTSTMRQAMRIVGPAVGSAAILLVGIQGTFAVMAAAQVVAVVAVAAVRLPRAPHPPGVSAAADLREGFRFIAANRSIRALLLVSAVPALSAMAYQSLTPVFAKDVLGRGDAAVGVMLTATGVGALVGSGLMTASPVRLATPFSAAAWAALFGLAVAAFAVSRAYPLSLALLAAAGMTNALSSIAASSAIQQRTPSALQGRVMGVYQTTWELLIVGSLLAGALADVIGAPAALAVAGIGSTVAVGALIALPGGVALPSRRRTALERQGARE